MLRRQAAGDRTAELPRARGRVPGGVPGAGAAAAAHRPQEALPGAPPPSPPPCSRATRCSRFPSQNFAPQPRPHSPDKTEEPRATRSSMQSLQPWANTFITRRPSRSHHRSLPQATAQTSAGRPVRSPPVMAGGALERHVECKAHGGAALPALAFTAAACIRGADRALRSACPCFTRAALHTCPQIGGYGPSCRSALHHGRPATLVDRMCV